MNNFMGKNLIDRMFKQVDGVVWDLMSGSKVGLKTKEGIVTCELNLEDEAPLTKPTTRRKTAVDLSAPAAVPVAVLEAPDAQISLNLFDDFGMAIPAFAQSTPVESIALGDLIYSSSAGAIMGWVVKKSASGKSFKILKRDGTRTEWSPPKVQMLGFDSGVMVVRSLLNMLPGGAAGANGLEGFQGGMGQMLMMTQMMGVSEDKSEGMMSKMIPIMLMGQLGGAGGANPMGNMMQTMMMMQLLKGDGGNGSKDGRSQPFFNR